MGNALSRVEIVRQNGKYFPKGLPQGDPLRFVQFVERVGKHIAIGLAWGPWIVVHNAMSGYFDWEHDPWTFDYVEGDRDPTESDVRVRFEFADGKVLRFHDTRCFGFMYESDQGAPVHGPELMRTPNMAFALRIITLEEFARGIYSSDKSIKELLMDQEFLSGIGNIYSVEALHLIGVDPRTRARDLYGRYVPILLEGLRLTVERCIPKINYGWLNVYRRPACGTCGGKVTKVEIAKRSTFFCERCQT